jgi:putative transposase
MARKLRIEYPGAVYHVMARGNIRQKIFKNDKDRDCFLSTLAEVCEQTGWIVHAYVLMDNHYHMLLESPEANLVAGMKWFQGTYTQRFNSAHRRSGHLYQGRYKALIIDPESDGHFSTVSTYLHLNPFRANLAGPNRGQVLEKFHWSSYPYYLQPPSKRPKWLCVQRVLESCLITDQSRNGRMKYKKLIEARMIAELDPVHADELIAEYRDLRRGWILGESPFRERMLKLIEDKNTSTDNLRGDQRREHGIAAAEILLKKALNILGLGEEDLISMKSTQIEKQAVAWLLKKQTVVTGVWLADRLEMGHRVNASRAISSFEKATSRNVENLKKKMLQCTG